MPLKLVKRPKSPNWIMRGTVRGQSVEETTGTSNKEAADAIRIKRENEILTESIYGKALTVTFKHGTLDYLEHGNAAKRFLGRLVDHFGATLLRSIDQHAIDLAAAKLYPKAGPATRNRQVYTPVSAILQHAARKGWCPVPVIARPKQPACKIRWITPDEADRLLDACAPHLRPLVVFLLYTGARAGEAVWLDWRNVNLEKRQATFQKTKNGSARSVPLHARVIEELTKLQHRKDAVFLTDKGFPYKRPRAEDRSDVSGGTRISTSFQGACRRAGIADFTPHGCRHTWATWHYQANRDFTALQKLGGWETASMVFRYAHTNVEEHANSIDNLPWGKSGETQFEKTES